MVLPQFLKEIDGKSLCKLLSGKTCSARSDRQKHTALALTRFAESKSSVGQPPEFPKSSIW